MASECTAWYNALHLRCHLLLLPLVVKHQHSVACINLEGKFKRKSNIFSISCSFSENLTESYPFEGQRPPTDNPSSPCRYIPSPVIGLIAVEGFSTGTVVATPFGEFCCLSADGLLTTPSFLCFDVFSTCVDFADIRDELVVLSWLVGDDVPFGHKNKIKELHCHTQ